MLSNLKPTRIFNSLDRVTLIFIKNVSEYARRFQPLITNDQDVTSRKFMLNEFALGILLILMATLILLWLEFIVTSFEGWLSKNNMAMFILTGLFAHATTSFVFWLSCALQLPGWLPHIPRTALLASFVAVGVDIDHFIAAGSLSLKDAQNLRGRPFLHWTGGLLILSLILILISQTVFWLPRLNLFLQRYLPEYLFVLYWTVISAWFSHQLRDGIRHGLWLWPPPSPTDLILTVPYTAAVVTPPLPLFISYPLGMCLLSLFIHGLLSVHSSNVITNVPAPGILV